MSVLFGIVSSIPAGADEPVGAERISVPPRRVTFAFTGDVLTHRAVNYSAAAAGPGASYSYTAMFAGLAPVIKWADVAVCHLEPPVATSDSKIIVAPPLLAVGASVAPALASAGYDRCSTASNHSLDGGKAGVDATVAALTASGIGQSGMARSAAEAVPEVFVSQGVRIAHLSYTFGLNGIPLPPGEPWRANVININSIIAAARDARARGAEAVVLSLHWGIDKIVAPTADQRAVANAVTASGEVDLIVGHHAHVLQPIEKVNGTWVVWGLGNVLSDHPTSTSWPAASQDAAVVSVAIEVDAAGTVSVETPVVYPTWVDRAAGHIIRFTWESRNLTLPTTVRTALVASENRTRSLLGPFFGPPPP